MEYVIVVLAACVFTITRAEIANLLKRIAKRQSHSPTIPRKGAISYRLDLLEEIDGRWVADFVDYPGVMAYGENKVEAVTNAARILAKIPCPACKGSGKVEKDG